MFMFGKKSNDNGEKLYRYSIRKYHFGAASVAIAALMFFANGGGVAAAEVVTPATANPNTHQLETTMNSGGDSSGTSGRPENTKEINKPAEVSTQASVISDRQVGKETGNSTPLNDVNQDTLVNKVINTSSVNVTDLQTALAELESKLTNVKDDEEKGKFNTVVVEAKKLLGDKEATQEQVNQQLTLVKETISSVEALLKKQESKVSEEETKKSEKDRSAEVEASNRETATPARSARGRKGRTTEVQAVDSENATPTVEAATSNKVTESKELPTYTNGAGTYALAEEMRNIIDYMKQNGADTNEVAAIKANYDQLNMVLGAHEDGVLPEEEFKRAVANLTGARNKIEEFLNRNTIIPGTERSEVTLHNRQTREYGLNFQDSREYYYEDGKRGISPYSKYTYVFHNYRAANAPKFDHQPVSNAEKYIHVRVDPTATGFLWTVSVNAGRFSNTTNDSYWFTIPKGQHYKQGSANVDVQNLQGTNSYQGDGSLEGAMRQAGLLQVNKGANLQGVFRHGKVGANAYKTDNLEVLARENVDALTDKGFYNRVLEQGEEQKLSNEKFNKIKKTGGDLYYFEQPSNVFKYTITFETVGDANDPNRNDPDDLVYAAGFKGITRSDKVYRVLVNQWHAQTDAETSNIDRYRMTLKNGGTFFVEQNKYYNKLWPNSDHLIGNWYGTKNLNPDIKKVDGIITSGDQQNFTSIDIFSYINYKPQKGKNFETIKYEANDFHGQKFTFYREDGTPISAKDLGAEAGGSPGVHTYYYRRYFASDGSSDSGKFRFIVKLKNPVLAPTTKYAGENHTFTASGSTKGSPVTLWREYIDESGHKQTQEIDTKVVENNNGTVTFKEITLEKGKYYVHSKIATDSYLDYNGKKHSTVESDPVTENQKNVIVEPPVVKINGHKLTTNANDNQFIIYKGANFNPRFQVENEGNQVNYLKVTNIPKGVWFNNVNGSDKEKVNMASGSTHTLADNTVENSARDGEASVTVRNHNNREVVYKFKYIIADVQPSNASRDKRVGDILGDPHGYVKAVVNGGEGDQYFPSQMRFGWVTNRATLADQNTVLDRPGNIGDYNAQVIFPNNRPVEKEINHVNYTIYTPVAKTIPVGFNVTDTVAPTVKMTNPNNTDSTLGDSENGAPEVEVFRGATLNIPLKMHDNNVHGKINIKQISGLPAGVTLKDGNTVINNGNTLSKNSGSETNPATATITGTVASNATLGTNVVTLKVSDDATGNVDRGNQATLKFKVKTYDLAFEEKGTRVDDNTRSDVLRLNENSVDPNHYLAITDGRNVTNNWGSGMVFRYLKENREIREHVSFDKIGKHSVKARAYFPTDKTSTKGLSTNPPGLTGDTATNGRGFLEKTIEFNVKPNAPTIDQPQFYGTASSKPTVTVGNLPTNAQLQNGSTVTVELYQGNNKVATKTVTDGNATTTLSASNFTANLTEGQPVYAVVKVSGGRDATAYSLTSDNSERRNVTGRSTLNNLASDKLVVQVQDLNRNGALSETEKNVIKTAIFEANKNGVLRGKQVSDITISDTGLITALDKDNKIAELQINPRNNIVTRFAHIRDDYNITFTNKGKPANRPTDPGFEWSSDHKSLIYKFDATSGVGLAVNEVLKTITATPKNAQNQPSLTTVTGNDKASGEAKSNGFSKNATSGYFTKNGVGVNVLDLVNPTDYRGGGNIDNTTNKLVDKNRTGLNSSNVGTTLGNDSISVANGANAISLSNVVKKANGTDSLVVRKQLYLMPKYTDATLLTDRGTTATANTNVINVYFVPVDPTAPQVERSTSNHLATTSDQASRLADNTSFTSLAKVTDNYDKDDVTNPSSNTVRSKLNMWVKKGDTKVQIVANGVENTAVINSLKKEIEPATYEVIAKTSDASGNQSHENNSDGASLGFFKVGYDLVARETINVKQGERLTQDELNKLIQVREGNTLQDLPQGATVRATLETNTITRGSEEIKTVEATVDFGQGRTKKLNIRYRVLRTFPIANLVYDFHGQPRNDSELSYYTNTGLPQGMSWYVKKGTQTTNHGRIQEFLREDGLGTTEYTFGAKYNAGRFTNRPEDDDKLKHEDRLVHKVFDVMPNPTKVTVDQGASLSDKQAKDAVIKVANSENLPEGTTYEWVNASGVRETASATTSGEQTFHVKITLPKSQLTGSDLPGATQVQPSKIIPVTVNVTPPKPTFDPTPVTSTSRTITGTLGGLNASAGKAVVRVALNDGSGRVLTSENNGGVTINGNTWTATLPNDVKLRQSVQKNGENVKPANLTVTTTIAGTQLSRQGDDKVVQMGSYAITPAIAGSKHIDITVPHDAKRVELRFHNSTETSNTPKSIVLVRGADGTWHTDATRANNTAVANANGYVGRISSTVSTTNPAENNIRIELNEQSGTAKLHIKEENANGNNTESYGSGLGLRVYNQPEAGQEPSAAGKWKVANVTNTKPTLSHKGTEASNVDARKVFPSGTSITKEMLENLVTVGDREDKVANEADKPYGTPTIKIVSGLTETPGNPTPAGRYTVVLKAVDSQGKESDSLTVYVGVVSTELKYQPQVDNNNIGDAVTIPVTGSHKQGDSINYTPGEITVGGKVYVPVAPGEKTVTLTPDAQTINVAYKEKPSTSTPTFTVGTQNPLTGNVEVTVDGVPEGTKVKLPGIASEKVVTGGKVELTNNELPENPTTGKGIAQEDGKLPKEGTSNITIPGKLTSAKGEPAREFEVTIPLPIVVPDPEHLTPKEIEKLVDKVKESNPNTIVTADDKGNVTVTDKATGESALIPAKDLTVKDFEPVKPTEKVPVKDKAHLTPEEKKQVADKVKAKNPGKEVTVGDDGTATVTDPTTGISHTIPGTDLVNQDFEPVKPTEKVPVKDKAHLTPEEKKQVADKVKDKNPGKEVTVGDDGTATVTDPTTGISHTIPGTELVNQDFEPVKPTEKVPVKDKAHLTPEEKKQVADKVKDKNPGKEVTVGDDGTATVTDPTTGISHTIPGTELVNQDFEPVKPTEKVPVKDKSHLTPEEKKQVADNVKAKNPGKEVTVGDDGTATVTDPTTGISHIIPATDLVIEFAKGDSTRLEVPGLIITKWTDEQGNELKPADAKAPSVPGEANEAFEHGEIEGYVFVRTETKGDVVTHIFRKVSPARPTGDDHQEPATPSADTNPRPNNATPAEASATQPQAVLPNTGTQEDRATGAFGLLSLLGAFGLLFAKKKKDDEEEA